MFHSWLLKQGFSPLFVDFLDSGSKIVCLIFICWLSNIIAKKYILEGLRYIIHKTENKWDDILFEKRVFLKLSHLAPALVIYFFAAFPFPQLTLLIELIQSFALVYMTVVGSFVIDSLLNAALDIYQQYEVSKSKPIKGYIQAAKIIMYIIATIIVVSILIKKSPWGILSLFGGLTAVILLVFKDTILGFVAGIQLISNNMVARGDWIEMPKYGADGDVIDITLNTIKVQNWDKTITTIPTYALISDSFKNWRGMSQSGGRRIKRALYLDMNSIKFLDDQLIQNLMTIDYLKDYLFQKQQEIEIYNKKNQCDTTQSINGRRLTNIGTFRAYLNHYLKHHPKIHTNMTFLVRHLQPSPHGLPIEIYVFSNDQVWANYEAIQADIFDHIIAVVPIFDLRVFQHPSGYDFQKVLTGQNL